MDNEVDDELDKMIKELKLKKKKKNKDKDKDISDINDVSDSVHLYTYEQMLDKITVDSKKKKTSLPMIRILISDIETTWTNILDISIKLSRTKENISQFFIESLSCNLTANSLVISGLYSIDILTELLKKYINMHIACKVCKCIDTVLIIDKKTKIESIKCNVCLPNVSIMSIGPKTIWKNLSEISDKLSRPINIICDYFLLELSTTGSLDGTNNFIIKGHFSESSMEAILQRFISTFSTCNNCKNTHTTLDTDTKNALYVLTCPECKSHRYVDKNKKLKIKAIKI